MVHGKPGSVMGLRHLLIRPRRCTMPDHDRPPTVAVVTLGCGRNEVDSENVAGLLSASGFRMVADPERADAVVVNTCAFIQAKGPSSSLSRPARPGNRVIFWHAGRPERRGSRGRSPPPRYWRRSFLHRGSWPLEGAPDRVSTDQARRNWPWMELPRSGSGAKLFATG